MSVDPTQLAAITTTTASSQPTDLNKAVIDAATKTAGDVAGQAVSGLAARLTALEQAAAPVLVAGVTQDISAVTANVAHDTWLKRVITIIVVATVAVVLVSILVAAELGNAWAQGHADQALAGILGLAALVANVEGVTLPTKSTAKTAN